MKARLFLLLSCLTFLAAAGCSSIPTEYPVKIISVIGFPQAANPAGPIVQVTLQNVSGEDIVALDVALTTNQAYSFDFGISEGNPLLPGQTSQKSRILVGGSFDTSSLYPLLVSGTFEGGQKFTFTEQVGISVS